MKSSFSSVLGVVFALHLLLMSSSTSTSPPACFVEAAGRTTRNHRGQPLVQHETSARVFWKNVESAFPSTNQEQDDDEEATTPNINNNNNNNSMWLFTVIVGLAVAQIMVSLWNYATLETRLGMPVLRNPPQGPSLPFIGQALNFLKIRPWDLMMQWHRQYGPIVCFPLLGATMFSIGSPQLIKIVLQSQIESVKKDVQNVMKPFLVILGTGIVTSEDKSWMKQRLKMSQPLRRDVLEMIPKQTLLAVQRLVQIMDTACDTGEPIPVGKSLRHLTLQVISGTFLSLSAQESDSTFANMYLPIVDESNARVWHPYRSYCVLLPAFWKQIYNVRRLNTYVSKLIRERWILRRQEEKDNKVVDRDQDILDRVMVVLEKELVDENGGKCPDEIPEYAVKQLRDEMKTFMLAGHETSAAMMTWAIYELMGNASLRRRVADEAQSVFEPTMPDLVKASASDLPSPEVVAKLELSEATLRESLRKYSVVPTVARRTIQDLYMTDNDSNGHQHRYLIPKGSSILINIQAVHHDPALWPEPMKFDPDRFLGKQEIKPYTFLPFIAGPRNCLGQYLALLESKMVIGMLTHRYNFSLPPGKTVQVKDWDASPNADPRHRYMVPVIPQEELMVHVTRKLQC